LEHWHALQAMSDAAKTPGGPLPESIKLDDEDALWDEGIELIGESLEGIDRAVSIVRDIKTFSHGGSHERELTDLTRLLDATLRIASPQLRHRVRVERDDGELPVIECAPREIQQVFLNLLLNAIDATPEGESGELPCITIETRADGRNVRVRFTDEGDGIADDCIDCIFDPFFTTKPAGKGTGLGLALSYEIVRRHDGDISVQSEVGAGTCFTVVLPRPAEE
ncbi:MAG: HAMP domain-containing histidine kinase, partial [Actinomycetota bacterium]|nr:HAMP domain-containing histidine kinase [Actinomycetota bacterium]